MRRFAIPLVLSTAAMPALADLRVEFVEGAPKDRFVIENTGACALENLIVEIDLGSSAAGLIFDVTNAGAGVDVFQPLEVVTGAALLVSVPQVTDGDNKLRLPFHALASGQSLAFTIDVDDTKGTRATMISATEIEGAAIRVDVNSETVSARFGQDAVATAALGDCLT